MSRAIVGLVSDIGDLEYIISSLKVSGFRQSDISLLLPDTTGVRDIVYEKHTKAPEGLSYGVTFGAIVGGVIAYLASIGEIHIQGFANLIAIGPAFAFMSGVAFGGALFGILGGMIGLSIPEYEAKQYAGKVDQDNILLSVHADTLAQERKAEAIFKSSEAREVTAVEEKNIKPSRKHA